MNNNNEKLIGSFDLQAQVYKKIEELKEQGYREEDMHVIAKNGADLDALEGKTKANITTGENSDWKNKFKSVFSSDDTTTDRSYTNIGEDKTGNSDYNQQVEDGKILLYVDREFGGTDGGRSTMESGLGAGTAGVSELGRGTGEEESLRLHEERLNVDKERVQTGEVNVGKNVVEEEQSIEVPVEREEVYVERRPVNEETTGGTVGGLNDRDAYQEGEDIHIPVSEERLDVSKKDVVSEEVVVGKRKVKDTERVNETVRREEADIDEDTRADNGLFNDKDDDKRGL